MSYTMVNFYKFVHLEDLDRLKTVLQVRAKPLGLTGNFLLAPEGINGAFAGSAYAVKQFGDYLQQDERFTDVVFKTSSGSRKPFKHFRVKIKDSVIRFAGDDDPPVEAVLTGKRVSAAELHTWLRNEPDLVTLVDTRNWYETDHGSFDGAELLPIQSFTEFPKVFLQRFAGQWNRRFVFFCTGGIRCEKVAPWAEAQGFTQAYQLDGGIIEYFRAYGSEGFNGNCFVFDHRWLLDGQLQETWGNPHDQNLRIQPKPLYGGADKTSSYGRADKTSTYVKADQTSRHGGADDPSSRGKAEQTSRYGRAD